MNFLDSSVTSDFYFKSVTPCFGWNIWRIQPYIYVGSRSTLRFSALTFCWFLGMILLLGLRHHCGISVSSDWETGNGINILRCTPVSEIHSFCSCDSSHICYGWSSHVERGKREEGSHEVHLNAIWIPGLGLLLNMCFETHL